MDERVIGAGTTVRFVLLMVLLFVTSGAMMDDVLSGVSGSSGRGCELAAGADPDGSTLQTQLVLLQQAPAYKECRARKQPPPPWWAVLGWPVVVVLGAGVLFRAIPAWRTRSRWVKPLDDDHDAHRLVGAAAVTAGLVRLPRLVVDSTRGVAVYGSNRRPILRLGAESVIHADTDPERFRGVVLHELAHIRNGDITLHYVTVALWRMFLGAVLVPYAVWTIYTFTHQSSWSSDEPTRGRHVVLVVVLALLVYLARADVLRSREVCADLAAARWGAPPRSWDVSGGVPARRRLAAFTELWRTHPRLDQRRAAMAGTAELFGLRALPMFLTGVAATLVNRQSVDQVQFYLAEGGLLRAWIPQALMLVPSGLFIGIVGIALWRAVVRAVQTSRPVPSGARTGMWLGFGLAAGELLLDRLDFAEWLPSHPEVLVLLVLAGTAATWWIGQCAHLWATVGQATWQSTVATLGAAWLVLASWFAWWDGNAGAYAMGTPIGTDQVRSFLASALGVAAADGSPALTAAAWGLPVMNGLSDPALVVGAVCALWIVPLTAWTVRPADGTPRWLRAALDDTGVVAVEEAPIPRLRRALLPGVVGGVLAGLAVVGVQAHLRTWRPLPPGTGALFGLTYLVAVLVAVVAAAVVIAFVAAVRAGHYRLLVALIAAETAAVIGFALALALLSLDGCVAALSPVESTCGPHFNLSGAALREMLTPVVVVAAIAAFAAAAVATIIRRVPAVPARAQGTLAARRRVVAVLCVAATAITVTGAVQWARSRPDGDQVQTAPVYSPPAARQVSAHTHAVQVAAWYEYGGMELHRRLDDVLKRHAALLVALGSATTERVDVSPLRSTCAEFGQLARDAERYFRAPDDIAQEHWHRYIKLAGRGSANCVTALDQGPERLLYRSLDELNDAVSAGNSALGRLEQVQNAGVQPQGGR